MKVNNQNLFASLGLGCGSLFVFSMWFFLDFESDYIVGKMLIVLGIVSGMTAIFFFIRSLPSFKIKFSQYDSILDLPQQSTADGSRK